jgi:hypothetical protein
MSDFVKLSPSLPGGDANGLGALALDLTRDPTSLRVIISLVDCVEITTKTDTGILIPKIRLRRAEALLQKDAKTARLLMRRAWENRTGRDTLPIEIEEDFDRAFGEEEPR